MDQKDSAVDRLSKGDGGRKLSKKVGWQLKWKERRLKQKGSQKSSEKKETKKPKRIDKKDGRVPRQTVARNTFSKDRHGNKRQHADQIKRERKLGQHRKRKSEPLDGEPGRKPKKVWSIIIASITWKCSLVRACFCLVISDARQKQRKAGRRKSLLPWSRTTKRNFSAEMKTRDGFSDNLCAVLKMVLMCFSREILLYI